MLALAMLLSLNMTVLAADGEGYGGTLPFEVATTGVKGLATIIPYAGIASWYDYTNSQGVPIVQDSNYMDCLAAFNCGGTFLDLGAEQLGFVPENDIIDYNYSYIIDNDSLQVRLPVAGK